MTPTGQTYVVGLSAFHHDSAACILRDGDLLGAVEEERFTRRKHQGGIPVHAFRWCLEAANISIGEISAVGVGIDPDALADRRAAFGTERAFGAAELTERSLRATLGIEAPLHFVSHHRAHAASAYHFSGYDDAAVLVADGVGDWPCTTMWRGSGDRLNLLKSWDFPDSLGLFYAAITSWLGFRVNNDEYKVMGLAAYGKPSLRDELALVLQPHETRGYALDLEYFGFFDGQTMYSERLVELIGPARQPGDPISEQHRNVAATAQQLLEDRLLALAIDLHDRTGTSQLCVAGGVGLNAVANARLAADGPFEDVFFQPAAGDAGTALGAASTVMLSLYGPRPAALTNLRLGPTYDTQDAAAVLSGAGVPHVIHDEAGLVEAVADLIANGGVVGWFQGPMEFGPRALGARCLLADPRSVASRDRINMFIKDREPWRPLAPIVAKDKATEYFDTKRTLRFMIETARVRPNAPLGAVTHVDGTARPQMIEPESMATMGRLLRAVEDRIGVAVLVSTSFNHASEPIVMTPQDALLASSRLGLDALVIDQCLITELQPSAVDRVAIWQSRDNDVGAPSNLYPL